VVVVVVAVSLLLLPFLLTKLLSFIADGGADAPE